MEGLSYPAKQVNDGGHCHDGGKNRLGIKSLSGINHSGNSGENILWGRGRCSYSGKKGKNGN